MATKAGHPQDVRHRLSQAGRLDRRGLHPLHQVQRREPTGHKALLRVRRRGPAVETFSRLYAANQAWQSEAITSTRLTCVEELNIFVYAPADWPIRCNSDEIGGKNGKPVTIRNYR